MKLYIDIPFLQQYKQELTISLNTIDLSANKLGSICKNILVKALTAIPIGVRTLNLGFNDLSLLPCSELALVLASIPAGVISLNLEWNYLGSWSAAELAIALGDVPAHVTTIDLSNNQLQHKTDEEWILILSKLPDTVTKINCEPECQLRINTILQKLRTQAFITLEKETSLPKVINILVEDYITSASQSLRDKKVMAHNETMINSSQEYTSVIINTALNFAINTYNFWATKTKFLKPCTLFREKQPESDVEPSSLNKLPLR